MKELEKIRPKRTTYNLISKIQEKSGYKFTKEDAAFILAGKSGIDITKYASEDVLDRIRNAPIEIKIIETKSKPSSKTIDLKIQGISAKIPFLKNGVIQDCKKMSETYQLFYLLENSIRYFILATMDTNYPSEDWWENKVRAKIKGSVEFRMKLEEKNRWHAQRGSHYIHYTNFGDLIDIIKDNWVVFKKFFPNQHWIISRLQDLELSRNIIAHTNPLPKQEKDRIKFYFRDLKNQLRGN